MNNINLVGRITKDLDLKYTASNKAVCEFTIAINRIGSDKADFINIQVWNAQAENLARYQGKGSLIAVVGSLRVDTYQDTDGNNKYKTYVLAQNIEYLGTKKDATTETIEETTEETPEDAFKDFGQEVSIELDDLPF